MTLVIGADLGTSGCKLAVFDEAGHKVASTVRDYPTHYPAPGFHEQRPEDWWDAFSEATRVAVAELGPRSAEISAIGLSGQSLAMLPLDERNELLLDSVPIWSDARAQMEADAFFEVVDQASWYRRTGNGFPAPLYTLFKIMWMRRHASEVFARTHTVIGSKDWINFQLTGRIGTDPSYASGLGAFDLLPGAYAPDLLSAAGLSEDLFPPVLPSASLIGQILPEQAAVLGLPASVGIVCGGVDNSCMALGAGNTASGRIYASLGSSSWLTLCDHMPVLDDQLRPFVFAHVIPGLFNSAVSTFSSGTSATWAAETLLGNLEGRVEDLVALGMLAEPGAGGAVFVPSINGGTVFEGGPDVRGALVNISGLHRPEHLARAVLESIPMALRLPLDRLRELATFQHRMVVTGGGARSSAWLQLYADILDCTLVRTTLDQQTATLGAAALALVGTGVWDGFARVDDACGFIEEIAPSGARTKLYVDEVLPRFAIAAAQAREFGRLSAT